MELRPCDNAAFVAQRRGSQDLLTLVFSLYLMSPLTIQTLLLLLHHPLPLPVKGGANNGPGAMCGLLIFLIRPTELEEML